MNNPNAKRYILQTYHRGEVGSDGGWSGRNIELAYNTYMWNTVTIVNKIAKLSCRASYEKNGGKFPDFEIQEIQELKENSENQNTKKSTSTWLNAWTSWAENKSFKTNLLAYEAKQLDKNKQMALYDWIFQVVV